MLAGKSPRQAVARKMGFSMAIGIPLASLVVSSILVPATTVLVGSRLVAGTGGGGRRPAGTGGAGAVSSARSLAASRRWP
jgi:uncharacterized membrane protein YdfJ with MMPL/SSD domain